MNLKMMVRKINLICLTLIAFECCQGQSATSPIDGFWQNSDEQSIIDYFDGENYYSYFYSETGTYEGGQNSQSIGFYHDCNLPSIDSLKLEGQFFFKVRERDWDEDGYLKSSVLCGEMNFIKEENKELMTIYYSERQQWVTYEKLYRLPEGLEKYLAREHPEVYQSYLEIKR